MSKIEVGEDTTRQPKRGVDGVLDDVSALVTVPDWIALHPLLANYFCEAVGTFIFTLTFALVGINNPHPDAHPEANITALPIGFMLMALVFAFGYISGGHFNPAVTLAVMFTAMEGRVKMLGYIVCQCGAALGAGMVAMIIEGTGLIVPHVKNNDGEYIRRGVFAELIFTFALATTVLHVAYSRQKHNFFYGFSIGMVVVAGACSVGGVSGGAFNPAVATGLQVAACLSGNCTPLIHFWIYWIAPVIGALAAAFAFALIDSEAIAAEDGPDEFAS
jgi:glycerol uptake facilitator-like aquaporin